jgi:hypothetical protein
MTSYSEPRSLAYSGLSDEDLVALLRKTLEFSENHKQILRAQQQLNQILRITESAQEQWGELREELSLAPIFSYMDLIEITNKNSRAKIAGEIERLLKSIESSDFVAMRDAVKERCESNITEIQKKFKEGKRFGFGEADMRGGGSMRADTDFYTLLLTVLR